MPIGSHASCVTICDELEAWLRRTCFARVSVRAITFTDIGMPPDHFPIAPHWGRRVDRPRALPLPAHIG